MRLVLLVALCLLLGGCLNFGPRVVEAGRAQYNMALQRTDDQQLLLNIVRLRYRDRPYFLEVSGVATQFSFKPSVSALVAIGSPKIEQDAMANGVVAMEEQPTVTYTPLQGSEFARQLLAPVSLDTLLMLSNSGWSVGRVLRLAVQSMNGLPNAPSAAGPTPEREPRYRRFRRVTTLLRELQINGEATFGCRRGGDEQRVFLCFSGSAPESPQYDEIVGLLGLDRSASEYQITASAIVSPTTIRVQTRSFLAMMYFLSQAVEAPPSDLQEGRVTATRLANGATFDWSLVTGGLMAVRSAEKRPKHAAVAVRYRNRWFYIDDADLDAKSTFSLLGQVFALTSSATERTGPLLTLPVGN